MSVDTVRKQVVGDKAHDAVDGGHPVKIAGVATDMTPDTEGEQGPSNVADGDRAQLLVDRKGRPVERVLGKYELDTTLDDTFDNVTTTVTGAAKDCEAYRWCSVQFDLSKANTPTDILFEVQISPDGTNWFKLTNGPLGAWIYDDTAVGAGIIEALEFPICARKIRTVITATGTTASNTFTTDDSDVQSYIEAQPEFGSTIFTDAEAPADVPDREAPQKIVKDSLKTTDGARTRAKRSG